MLNELEPSYGAYAQKGSLVVRLDKALYGCLDEPRGHAEDLRLHPE